MSIANTHFVGRNRDIAFVTDKMREAVTGTGFTLFVTGEGGIGKSRFLQQCGKLRLRNIATYHVDCGESSSGNLVQTLGMKLSQTSHSSLERLRADIALSERRKLTVFLLDDVHLLVEADFQIINALVDWTRHMRLAVIATIAAFPAVGEHRRSTGLPLARWIGHGAFSHALEPLDEPSAHVLARSLVAPKHVAWESTLFDTIVRMSGGNPRDVIDLVEQADARPRPRFLMPAVAGATIATLRDTLPAEQLTILATAAVIGNRFSDEWLMTLTESNRTVVGDALQAAYDMDVLEEEPAAEGFFVFRREAYREALCRSFVSSKRKVLHERIARMLSEQYPSGLYDALAAEHWARVGYAPEIQERLVCSARKLRFENRHAAAIVMYEQALQQTPNDGDQWNVIAYELADCYEAESNFKAAIPLREGIARALEREAGSERAGTNIDRLIYDYVFERQWPKAIEIAERVLEDDTLYQSIVRIAATLTLAQLLYATSRFDEAIRLYGRLSLEKIPDTANQMRYLRNRATLHQGMRELDETLADYDRSIEIADAIQSASGAVYSCVAAARMGCESGRISVARHYLEQAGSRIHAERDAHLAALFKETQLEVAVLVGDMHGARELLDALIPRAELGGYVQALLAGLGAFVAVRLDDMALIDALFRPELLWEAIAARDAGGCGVLLLGYAEVMIARGMTGELTSAVHTCIRERIVDPNMWVQLCAAQYAAPEMVRTAREYLNSCKNAEIVVRSNTALFDAFAAQRAGRSPASVRSARIAAALYREMGWKLYEAQSLELAGEISAAEPIYRACGAEGDSTRLRRRTTRKARLAPFAARLTARELDVASLLAKGMADREIAQRLHVSARTVHHHVEAIFSKLGIRARWQLNDSLLSRAKEYSVV